MVPLRRTQTLPRRAPPSRRFSFGPSSHGLPGNLARSLLAPRPPPSA